MANDKLYKQRMDILDELLKMLKPGVGKRTVAKELAERYPELFKDTESARTFIRTMTSSSGKNSHKYSLVRNIMGEYEMEDTGVPAEPFVVPKGYHRIGIISDIHSLYCDSQALEVAINYLVQKDVNALLINGDLIDFYQLSHFQPQRSRMHFQEEREWVIRFLKEMQLLFDNVYFKQGNHEKRYQTYMNNNAPVIFELPEFRTINYLFGYDNSTITFIPDSQRVKIGKLNVFHGHEFGKGGGAIVNIGRRAFMRGLQNVAVGHHHKTDSYSFKNFDNQISMGWAIGCLCQMNQAYAPVNQWNHGFATVELEDDKGNFVFNNKMIIDGKIYKA